LDGDDENIASDIDNLSDSYRSDETRFSFIYNVMGFDLREKFQTDMKEMLRDGSLNDVGIKLHDGEIKANKSVLAKRCEYFAATFRWKSNNNHDVEEIVVNDCSMKIMTRIVEYLFSGILRAKDLNLLDFLELKDQVQKILPGDKLEEKMDTYLRGSNDVRSQSTSKSMIFPGVCFGFSLPTNEEIVKALSLVETGNLHSQVLVEIGKHIGKERDCPEKVAALASLVYHGVMTSVEKVSLCSHAYDDPEDSFDTLASRDSLDGYESGEDSKDIERIQFKPLDLGLIPVDHLKALVSCVTGSIRITNVTNYDVTSLLDSLNCKELHLTQRLNREETGALVRAMSSRVEIVHLGSKDGAISLDVDTLTKYKGDGKCREVHCVWVDVWPSAEDDGGQVDGDHGGGGADQDQQAEADQTEQWIDHISIQKWVKEMSWIQSNIVENEFKVMYWGRSTLKVSKLKLEKTSVI